MVARKSPENLPSGWSEHVKVKNGRKIKYYTNASNEKRFYSKKAVVCYMRMKGNCRGRNQGITKRENRHYKRNINSHSSKTATKTDTELPPGWTVELKTRRGGVTNGDTYRIYIDPSGRRFYSKPEVSRHLKTVKNNAPVVEEKKHNKEESNCNAADRQCHMDEQRPSIIFSSVAVQSDSADELPPGWIKEIETRVNYFDPVSGYVFYSKKDALTYIETGDIGKCEVKPKKRDSGSETENESASCSAPGEKARQPSTKRPKLVAAPQAESIKRRLRSATCDVVDTREAEIKAENHLCGTADEGSRTICTPQSNLSHQQKLPGTTQSKSIKKRLRSAVCDVVSITQGAEIEVKDHSCEVFGEKPRVEDSLNDANEGTIIKSRKSRKNKGQGTPSRFSKRLAGDNPEEVADLGLGERVLRASIIKCSRAQGTPSQFSKRLAGNNPEEVAGLSLGEQVIQAAIRKSSKPQGTPSRFSKRLAGDNPEEVADLGLGERVLRCAIRKCSKAQGTPSQFSKRLSGDNPEEVADLGLGERVLRGAIRKCCKAPGTPSRFSKRLAGNNPEEVGNLCLRKRALRATIRKCSRTEPSTSSAQAPINSEANVPLVPNLNSPVQETGDCGETEADASLVSAASDLVQESGNSVGNEANADLDQNLNNPVQETGDCGETEADDVSLVSAASDPVQETGNSVGNEANADLDQNLNNPVQETRGSAEFEAYVSSFFNLNSPVQETRNCSETEANASLVSSVSNPVQEIWNSVENEAIAALERNLNDPVEEPRDSGESEAYESLFFNLNSPVQETMNCSEAEADASLVSAPSNTVQEPQSVQEMPQQTEEPTKEIELPKANDLADLNKPILEQVTENPRLNNLNDLNKPILEQVTPENPRLEDSQPGYLFGDCWSDPCLEFAFKTLTGLIPVEDCLPFDRVPNQQFDPMFSQPDACFDLPIFDCNNFFASDFPLSSGPQDNHASQDLPPSGPAFSAAPANTGLPSCSGFASQQPHLEPRKDLPAKAKS